MPSTVVLGVDFGGSKIAATVADAAGHRLGSTAIQVDRTDPAEHTFARGIDSCRELLDGVAAGCELGGVGACTFGIPHDDHVDLAPTITGWDTLAFGHELRAAFPGVPVRYGTDVKAAAQSEAHDGALIGFDPGIYLNLGTGLAAALVIGGRVLSGRHGAAGEIGYNLRQPADVDHVAPVVLENAVSGGALARLGGFDGAEDLFARTQTDPASVAAVDDFVTELAMHLVNLVLAIDPARVVVGGGITGSWSHLGPRLQRAITAHAPFAVDIVPARHPFDAPLLGALAMALAAAREPHPALQPIL